MTLRSPETAEIIFDTCFVAADIHHCVEEEYNDASWWLSWLTHEFCQALSLLFSTSDISVYLDLGGYQVKKGRISSIAWLQMKKCNSLFENIDFHLLSDEMAHLPSSCPSVGVTADKMQSESRGWPQRETDRWVTQASYETSKGFHRKLLPTEK